MSSHWEQGRFSSWSEQCEHRTSVPSALAQIQWHHQQAYYLRFCSLSKYDSFEYWCSGFWCNGRKVLKWDLVLGLEGVFWGRTTIQHIWSLGWVLDKSIFQLPCIIWRGNITISQRYCSKKLGLVNILHSSGSWTMSSSTCYLQSATSWCRW